MFVAVIDDEADLAYFFVEALKFIFAGDFVGLSWTDDYLLCEITKRYYKQLSGYFTFKEQKPIVKEIDSKICELSSEKIDSETLLHLNNFRCQNLELIKKSLEQELETVNKDIKFYRTIIDHSNKC